MNDPSTSPGAPIQPAPATGGGFPLWGKVLLGCGLVVLGLMVIAGGVAFWAIHRLTQPGPAIEPAAVVSERSVGWLRVESIAEDEGMSALVQRLFLVLQSIGRQEQREKLPDWLRGLYDLSQAQQANNPALKWLMPREMTVALEPVESAEGEDGEGEEGDGEDEERETVGLTASLNLGMLGRLIGWLGALDEDRSNTERIRGQDVIVNKDTVVALLDGTMLFAQDRAGIERLLERIETGKSGGRLDSDPRYSELADGAWDLFGRFDNRNGTFVRAIWQVAEWLGMDPATLAWTAEELTFRLDVVTAETLEAELIVDTIGEEAAEDWVTELDGYRSRLEGQGVRLTLDRRAEGRRVVAGFKVDGLAQWLGERIVTLVEEAEKTGNAPAEDLPVEDPTVEDLPAEHPGDAEGV